MAKQPTDVYEQARAVIRAEGFIPNPWRLGKWLGHMGLEVPSPYLNAQSTHRFNTGMRQAFAEYQQIGRVLWNELRRGTWYSA